MTVFERSDTQLKGEAPEIGETPLQTCLGRIKVNLNSPFICRLFELSFQPATHFCNKPSAQ